MPSASGVVERAANPNAAAQGGRGQRTIRGPCVSGETA